jgi:arginine:agmatine antiporter
VYCLWAIFGSSGSIVQYAFLFVLFITVFYPFFSEERRRQRGQLPPLDSPASTKIP